MAAFFPVALAMAVDPGWGMVLSTLAVFLVMELVSNNIIEVKLYGASTGISNLALLLAAVFWTWLWGTAGLFLSTPLTVCLLVLGRHVPGLKVLHMLLGSGPVLEPREQFYQRMLAMDFEEMLDRSELDHATFLEDGDPVGYVAHHRKIVRDKDVGKPSPLLEFVEQLEDSRLHQYVERRRRLVEYHHLRFTGEGAGDRDALALAARKRCRRARPVFGWQTDLFQELPHPFPPTRLLAEVMNVESQPQRGANCAFGIE